MITIENKKIYDTETAELIGEWENGFSPGDFEWYEQKLYKTEKGAYLLYGKGGPESIYGESIGSTTSGSEILNVITKEEAIDFCHERQLIEAVKKYFPDSVKEG